MAAAVGYVCGRYGAEVACLSLWGVFNKNELSSVSVRLWWWECDHERTPLQRCDLFLVAPAGYVTCGKYGAEVGCSPLLWVV